MEVLKCDVIIEDVGDSRPYTYKFIRTTIHEEETLYIYEFKYNNSGIELLLALNSSETMWLVDKEANMFNKFIKELDKGFKKYIMMIMQLYEKGGIIHEKEDS